ncbi:TlpA disulfide reductase family protein [Dysgonomonas sp. BGC7]|uniref:TlpA disulfide reductase family protein n=1 Tax=Dysgonomonas sp. BGC7 TaxID=1658008 RepID=UPI00068057F3|nr:TlpA disulfide reductase family protein [Dysgonomonas sp. BGC7]MBD8387540.1 AhpC/TSA family protein [Dysgonomonas sp. BGC7]
MGSKINIYLYTVILLLITLISSCNRDPNIYKVEGKLANAEAGHFYASYERGDSVHVTTITIDKNGEFSFEGEIDTLTVMSLYFNENIKNTFILVDKGWDVKIEGDLLYTDLIDVKGGSVNDDLTSFKNKNSELLKSRADILMSTGGSNTNNDSLPVKDYVVELKNINFELSNIAAAYIKANPDKIASVMLINNFFKDESALPRLDENLALLKGKAIDFPLTAELKKFRDKVKASSVGTYAPHFSLTNIQGKNIQLTDFRGKYLLLAFVSTTCDICKDEKKDAIAIYNELKKQKKNIEFVTIVKDIEQKPLDDNISDSIKWNIIPVNGGWGAKTFDTYYIREIPYNILISPTGYILERDLRISALPGKLKELELSNQK